MKPVEVEKMQRSSETSKKSKDSDEDVEKMKKEIEELTKVNEEKENEKVKKIFWNIKKNFINLISESDFRRKNLHLKSFNSGSKTNWNDGKWRVFDGCKIVQ